MKRKRIKRRRTELTPPSLRFSPTAWAKLRYLRDYGDTEIGGFGLSAADDLLMVEDFLPVRQRCTVVSVVFDDGAVADLYDELVDRGVAPERFGRIWVHTHPGRCPLPSAVDEATFARVFGRADWAVMAILARSDATYARLAFRAGPGGALELPVAVEFGKTFAGAEPAAWEQLYCRTVQAELSSASSTVRRPSFDRVADWWEEEAFLPFDLQEDFYGDAAEPF